MSLTRLHYVDACLAAIGAPMSQDNEDALGARMIQEWGSDSGQGPTDNALDLTQPEPGETPFNTFNGDLHVWNYTSLTEGVSAFHDILQASEYADVLADLRTSANAEKTIADWNKTAWGYCNPAFITQYRDNRSHYDTLGIPDATPAPRPAPVPPPLPEPHGVPTQQQLDNADLVVMRDVAQAEVAKANGWALWYFDNEHNPPFVAQRAGMPQGETLYANKGYEKKHRRLGRLPARFPEGLKTLPEYVTLPQPPSAAHWGHAVENQLGMDGNDTYGDCTIAGAAHALSIWNHEVDETIPVPGENECVSQYFILEGSPNGEPDPSLDNGLNMADVLETWQTTGLFNGTKIAAYAPVKLDDLTTIKQVVAFYGACYIGVNLPESAQNQFPNPWTVIPDSPIEGRHCILATGYDQHYLYCATWGQLVAVAWDWFEKYTEELWAIFPQAFVDAGKGPLKTADLAVLQAVLSSV